jgi:hypothetical protein
VKRWAFCGYFTDIRLRVVNVSNPVGSKFRRSRHRRTKLQLKCVYRQGEEVWIVKELLLQFNRKRLIDGYESGYSSCSLAIRLM